MSIPDVRTARPDCARHVGMPQHAAPRLEDQPDGPSQACNDGNRLADSTATPSAAASTMASTRPSGRDPTSDTPREATASPAQSLPTWVLGAPFVGLHLAAVAVFFVPVTWDVLLLCGLTYFWRMFGVTAGYHRYFAHRSFETGRLFRFVLAWLGCSCLQKGPLWWAAQHREHHRHSDTPEDPHSPWETSFWWSHVGWVLSPEHDGTPPIPDWQKYPELRWLDRWHWVPGLTLAGLCWLIAGWSGLVWGFVVSTILLYHAVFSINSLCHLFGSRRYDTPDASRNNWMLAIITLGEGWHNNHHHYQSSVNQGFFWYEIDVSYAVVWLLSRAGVCWGLRKPGERALSHRLIEPASTARHTDPKGAPPCPK